MSLLADLVDTWAALLRPRRSVALALVVVPLLWGQSLWNLDPLRGMASGAILALGTALIAPAAWRALQPQDGLVRVAAYTAISVACTWFLAIGLPGWFDVADRFLATRDSAPLVLGLFMAAGAGLGRDIDEERRLVASQARADALARDRDRAELLALRAQLDPHFLFNTLNAIAEWCVKDPTVAEAAVVRLSGLLRTVQTAVRTPAWPLADELALCRAVLELHRIRDPGRFASSIEGDPPAVSVPPMVLLPLVENAVKHGPAAGHEGPIALRVATVGELVRIEVENPGPYGGPRPGAQGLELLGRRLELAYGGRARLDVGAAPPGTRATLWLPRTAPEAA